MKQALLYLRDDLFPILSQTEDDTPEDSTPQYSITVDCTTVVVGDRYDQQVEGDDMSPFAAGEKRRQAALRFLPGEGFEVVGWIENLEQKVSAKALLGGPTLSSSHMFNVCATQMKGTASHLGPSVCPPLYILSAIHISPCETYLPHDSSRRRPL